MFVPSLLPVLRSPINAGLLAAGVAFLALGASTWISGSLRAPALWALQLLLVAPVIEEIFFRGVIQSALHASTGFAGRPWAAIAVTAACFGCAHLPAASVLHSVAVMVPAVAIGWLYERTRSIPLCIAAHSACNAIWLTAWSA